MPTNITFGGMALRSFGYTLGTTVVADNSFLIAMQFSSYLSSNSLSFDVPITVEVTSSGASVFAYFASTVYEGRIVRVDVNTAGTASNPTYLDSNGSGSVVYMPNTVSDSSGNIYLITSLYSSSYSAAAKLSSTNTVSGSRLQPVVGAQGGRPFGVAGAVDSSGNVWVLNASNYWNSTCCPPIPPYPGGIGSGAIYKYNSSFAYQNGYFENIFTSWNDIAADSSGNIILGGQYWGYCAGSPIYRFALLRKVSGATPTSNTWVKYLFTDLGNTSGGGEVVSLGVDSTGAVYALATNGTSTVYLFKFLSDGTFSWQRSWTIPGLTGFCVASHIQFDSSNNAYFAYQDFSNANVVIAKFLSNGGTGFFRTVTCSGNSSYPAVTYKTYCGSYSLVSTDPRPPGFSNGFLRVSGTTMYISFSVQGNSGTGNGAAKCLLKVPTDGTLTQSNFVLGPYTMSYSSSTVTVSTSSAAYGNSAYSGTLASGYTDTTWASTSMPTASSAITAQNVKVL